MEKFLAADVVFNDQGLRVDAGVYATKEYGEAVLPRTTWTKRQAALEQRRIAERTLELEQFRNAGLASDPAAALGLELHLARN
eukprot:2584115-Heterocapsa_arctica.AAC.1